MQEAAHTGSLRESHLDQQLQVACASLNSGLDTLSESVNAVVGKLLARVKEQEELLLLLLQDKEDKESGAELPQDNARYVWCLLLVGAG